MEIKPSYDSVEKDFLIVETKTWTSVERMQGTLSYAAKYCDSFKKDFEDGIFKAFKLKKNIDFEKKFDNEMLRNRLNFCLQNIRNENLRIIKDVTLFVDNDNF